MGQDIRRLLHQFAAGFLKMPAPALLDRLADHELESALRLDAIKHTTSGEGDSASIPLAEGLVEPPALVPVTVAAEPQVEPAAQPEPLSDADAEHLHATHFATFGPAELKPLADPMPAAHWVASSDPDDDAALADDDEIDAIDAVDAELFPIFEEEGQELLPQLADSLRKWLHRPSDTTEPMRCMRTLHTLKGGARLAGAMRLGEMAHRLESSIEHLLAREERNAAAIEPLQARVDALLASFEALRHQDAQAYASQLAAAEAVLAETEPPLPEPVAAPPEPVQPAHGEAHITLAHPDDPPEIDWSAFARPDGAAAQPAAPTALPMAHATGADRSSVSHSVVRVRASLLERLINHSGEVSIRRARIETETVQSKASLADLNENLDRLRTQLRDLELQAETQISSRMEAARVQSREFDPLEKDRFTRFQELTRMMAESVNDVATVQRNLVRSLQTTEDELAAQSRLTRDVQDDLLRTRMVEFEGLSDRLYRVVRQTSKETGKHVRLDIVGGSIEVDRGVLERMTASFEHLLRNCVTHGIELPDERTSAGKDPTGTITITLGHEGNEVAVEVRDDGRGLDLLGIRERGVATGLLDAGRTYADAELANLIFIPGFSTAQTVTELAGRGIGMDIVRSEVAAIGGRIETATAWGKGTSFRLVMPLTTAVTQVVMMRCGATTVALPSTLVEVVHRVEPKDLELAYASGHFQVGEHQVPFFWLGSLLQASARSTESGATLPVAIIRSAQQRVAVHVDEVLGNQEVVVKNLGVQLARLPGLVGITLLASGSVALIYNPVALAATHGDEARRMTRDAPRSAAYGEAPALTLAPLVMVVDDSLTVRRVTQRLLAREGYRVVVAKDGLDALERLAEERPAVMLSDIEMPRMDGFDLVRQVRADTRLADLPVIMITSRIAQKHRDYAAELGVDHYLGKPYNEEDLLSLVARYATMDVTV